MTTEEREALLDRLADALEHAGEGPEQLAVLHACLAAFGEETPPGKTLEQFRKKYGIPEADDPAR